MCDPTGHSRVAPTDTRRRPHSAGCRRRLGWAGEVRRSSTRWILGACGMVTVALCGIDVVAAQPPRTGLGTPVTSAEIATWGAIIGPDGEGLPPGRATAAEGRALYDRRCASCHGPTGQEGPDDRLAGGQGSLAGDRPSKTVGSYWPAATTLWDYVNRAMPFNEPGSLSTDNVYAVVAYVLFLNDLVGERDPVDARTLTGIEMPNRDGFVADPRPDTAAAR